jgi:hypothetical protein
MLLGIGNRELEDGGRKTENGRQKGEIVPSKPQILSLPLSTRVHNVHNDFHNLIDNPGGIR